MPTTITVNVYDAGVDANGCNNRQDVSTNPHVLTISVTNDDEYEAQDILANKFKCVRTGACSRAAAEAMGDITVHVDNWSTNLYAVKV